MDDFDKLEELRLAGRLEEFFGEIPKHPAVNASFSPEYTMKIDHDQICELQKELKQMIEDIEDKVE